MKQKIKIKAIDIAKQKLELEITLDTPISLLTQQEQRRWKSQVTELAFNMVREAGYMCQEIKVLG